MRIQIDAVMAEKIGFASHQNAVPMLRELKIVNDDEQDYKNLTLELVSDPAFVEGKTWRIDQLDKQAGIHVSDRDVKLNAALLADLTESIRGDITLKLRCEGEIVAEERFPVELLAKHEWGGIGSMAELLPAFVMPNDPAVDRILKSASEILRRAGKKDTIDGYTSQSRTRSWELVSAIWSAVCGLKLSYVLPPASFESQGQKVRNPNLILDGRVATCLDSSLLFAAAFEQAGFNPLLIITKGHAFVGVWLQPQEFSQLIVEEAASVRKRIDLKELVVVETTLATQVPAVGFSQAIDAAQSQVSDDDFILAIDIRRARMQRIRPLSLSGGTVPAAGGEEVVVDDALEEAPILPGFDIDVVPVAEGPKGKITLWQRKLLDLTTRNRLLHFPDSAKGVRFICHDPARLEDLLADGKRIRIVSLPELDVGGRDAELYRQQNRSSLLREYAEAALGKGEVLATLEKTRLEAELIDLYRKSRSDLEEGGANTLFLSIGFLKWKKSADDSRSYSAPLILLPVALDRKSALSGITMRMLEDEPRFNLTLLELLRSDFELVVPGLDGELPSDESGIDVQGIWNTVRRAVRDVPGFEVVEDLCLGTFSFAKYLMWKDLVDRSDALLQNRLVKHLLERKSQTEGEGLASGDYTAPDELDQKYDPANIFAPLPADSSQLAAVIASASGKDFVLDGPPGTGKSQTIANMIAHNLALGRRVLFVAEKRAALDVVYRRLEEKGLGEFCLELHSSKASKVEVLKQLERAWDTRDALSAGEWEEEARNVKTLRDKLNRFVAVLHQRKPNGLTLHQSMGRVIRDANELTPRLAWPEGTSHDTHQMAAFRDVARRLDLSGQAGLELSGTFGPLVRTDWSNGWQESMLAVSRELPVAIEKLHDARDQLVNATRLPVAATDGQGIESLIAFCVLLTECHGLDLGFIFSANANTRIGSGRRALKIIEEYSSLDQALSLRYAAEASRKIPFDEINAKWSAAKTRFWILATLEKRKIARLLAKLGGAAGVADVEADLPRLKQQQALLIELDHLAGDLDGLQSWAGLATNSAAFEAVLELGDKIRAGMSTLSGSPEDLIALRRSVSALIVDANDLLGPDGPVCRALSVLKEAFLLFDEARQRFHSLWDAPGADMGLAALHSAATFIMQNQNRLKAWCDWCRVREEAIGLGLKPLSDAVVAGSLPEGGAAQAFETAYARWFAAGVIDAEPLLRNFVSAEHMSDIEAYRKLDDRLSASSVRYIRAKLCGVIPPKNEALKSSGGFAILKHELQKSRRHKPVRQLAMEMGDAMAKLAPCMLMSPLSIAQYLPPEQALFDLVIFDEASQITPWDAVGSIARGKNVVIAGDPRQMPPTSFFNRGANAADDDTEEDMESILDECLGAGVPSYSLSWHYRSRHESLIAFSNHRYYESNLITFPAAQTKASAVEWRKVEGVYSKGKSRQNQAEAEAIVAEAVRRLTDPEFVASGQTLGIITLNSDQQRLVSDLLDRARQDHPHIESFFQEDLSEPVVVKNLETVQGDERDLIMLGIGYGPTEPGAKVMSMNFGPLNKEGGWRRLNVAITRARKEMLVFTSFDASMVDLNRTGARAVQDLKHFIEFAQRGPLALAEAVRGSMGGYESPFEEAVAEGLRRKGWQVVPQIGVSRFRIDLGIVHPDRPGDYLVGIECDGATYHSAATARDRDKVRSAILQGLGWKLLRLWSTDWWIDKAGSLDRLHSAIEAVLEESRRIQKVQPELADVVDIQLDNLSLESGVDRAVVEPDLVRRIAARIDVSGVSPVKTSYRVADLSSFSPRIDANQFYSQEYDGVLSELIAHILSQEAPIRASLLVERVARLHGFKRSGRLIRDRVLEVAELNHHLEPDLIEDHFVWRSAQDIASWNGYRTPQGEQDVRSIEEISIEELVVAALDAQSTDKAIEIARLFGIKRLTEKARARVELAINKTGA